MKTSIRRSANSAREDESSAREDERPPVYIEQPDLITNEQRPLELRESRRASGRLSARRLLVVGNMSDICKFVRRCSLDPQGTEIAATAEISALAEELNSSAPGVSIKEAIASARRNNVTDIVILTNWDNARGAARIGERFLSVPAAVHLAGLDIPEQCFQLGIGHLGTMATLVIQRQPLSALQLAVKRGFDVCGASIALLLLAPLLVLTAILIKLDSRGQVFFRQRRRGYNHREFRIFKFRTMTTADDGDQISQAIKNDPRTTRLGRILRKYNIDELPQLLNVLLGHMSLVGPRPHAVAHDEYYERIIQWYGRRLNMKPGITGWAQIHGHRGQTSTKVAMEARLEHDLYYIENWSLGLDIYTLLMTVVSKEAYRNAV